MSRRVEGEDVSRGGGGGTLADSTLTIGGEM